MSVTQQLDAVPHGKELDPAGGRKKSVWQMEITKKKVARKDLMHFSRQLSVFIRAGIPILDALEVIQEEMSSKALQAVLDDVVEQLKAGSTFATAAAAHPEAFPPYYLGILQSAEMTGHLDEVLDQLAGYIDRDLDARTKVKSAMTYPLIIMAMSVVVVVILVGFVLPRFETFFDGLGAELPLTTRMLLGMSSFVTSNWYFILAGIALVVAALLLSLRTQRGKRARDRVLLKVPVLGDVLHHVVLERFCRILASMMSAGVPLPEALKVTADATSNHVYRAGIGDARAAMLRGEGLAGPLAETGLFPASARQMFKVGESTGTLDDQLATAAVFFERELDYKIKRFTSLFEPAILVAVGLVVGFVAIALVSAMYGIFSESNAI